MDFSQIIPALPGLWDGMQMTLRLLVMAVLGGVILGTILALMRLSHSRLLSNLAGFYVNYFRSIPLLLVITWFYFAVPFILRWITGEDTPITRAAWTYSRFFSTSVEPRTVRAYWGQPASAMAPISTGTRARATRRA